MTNHKYLFVAVIVLAILAALVVAGFSDGTDHVQHLAGWTWGDGMSDGGGLL